MSKNITESAIEIANDFNIPLMLIASRRQIDSEEFGGGYVNNWTTKEFAKFVRNKDKKKKIFLCRDHGGPWQNQYEISQNLSLNKAMSSAKRSYLEDIKCGFDILHIDPSIDIHKKISKEEIFTRLTELYEFCVYNSIDQKKEILFEIGTEEQSGSTNTPNSLKSHLEQIKNFCHIKNFQKPSFVVVQCGTKVMENKNIGVFEAPLRVQNQIPVQIQVPLMTKICNEFDIMMKAHNGDYLKQESLIWHTRLGIHSINIAPEYGLEETKTIISILRNNKMNKEADDFLQISYDSKKWEKWTLPNTNLNQDEISMLSGHYVFSKENVVELLKRCKTDLSSRGVDLDLQIKNKIKQVIYNQIKLLRLLN